MSLSTFLSTCSIGTVPPSLVTSSEMTKAQTLLSNAGLTRSRVLESGITDWESRGFQVDRGV
ncbi:hypothetical protein [Mycobacterium simiae]|uniref:hypothetical protein n=1 Tax=Mycobacterium simiae TaxID=1784 RepID=UPI000CA6BC1D|nr:hypothetical protein X011_03515 [Mycobacterium tuberculosis variant microti OV254]BBX42865.1 hypothetical protein MSIM_43160 [Mycobacterium simiae]